MEESDIERLNRLREAGANIADAASVLKDVADQLRADVDVLADRITSIEDNAERVAGNLDEAKEVVEIQQVKQDDRLDTLENETL